MKTFDAEEFLERHYEAVTDWERISVGGPSYEEMSAPFVAELRAAVGGAGDDGEPVTFEWLAERSKRCAGQGDYASEPGEDVWWELGPISFTCDVYQDEPGGEHRADATDWQIDGDNLPSLMIPKTRGDVRRLCNYFGISLPAAPGERTGE